MFAERFIAWKFMLKGTEQGTFSAITIFGWLALAVGVWAMGSLLSVMYGFEGALKDRVLTAYPHIMVKSKGAEIVRNYVPTTQSLKTIKGVKRVTPFIETEMIVQSDFRSLGAVIQGLPMQELIRKSGTLVSGELPDLASDRAEALVGSELAKRLGLAVGSAVRIISPIESAGPMGLVPKTQTFEVVGIFSSGHYQFDQDYLFVPMIDAQDLLKKGDIISGWHVWGESYDSSEDLSKVISAVLPETFRVQSWGEFNSALFSSLKLEQFSMFMIFSFALAIAVMNIAITLMMYVVHKRKNIGILRAMGATRRQIKRIFLWQGIWIGGTGLLCGAGLTALTFLFLKYLNPFQLPDIYYDRSIPIEFRPKSMILIYGIAVILIYIATIYPSKKATDVDPIEAIRQ